MSEQENKTELNEQNPESPRHKPRRKLPLFLNLTTRLCSFLFLFLALISMFFFIGNNQSFLDSNLELILNFIAVTSIALLIFSLSGLVSGIYFISTRKNLWYLIAIFTFLVLIAVSVAMAILSLSVNILSKGL